MRSRNLLMASATAIVMLAAGCASGPAGPELEKTSIVVDAFPSIDSAGLYIAQIDGLFAQQGLDVSIVPDQSPPPTTQSLIDGQLKGQYDITAGDYVTYIDNQLGVGVPQVSLRLIAEASVLQPNVLALLVRSGSPLTSIADLTGTTISVNAANDIGTLLIDSLLAEHGIEPSQVKFNDSVAFPDVAAALAANSVSAAYAPEPFISQDEEEFGVQELADLDQGSTEGFPIEGFAVTQAWAKRYPNTLRAFTTALAKGQEIADTDRAAVEAAMEKYLNMPTSAAASISLPSFPTGLDPVRLQRVVDAMSRFKFLPSQDAGFAITRMTG